MARTIVALSGGLDSCVLLSYALNMNHSVLAVSFDYGSKHSEYELDAGHRVAAFFDVERLVVDIKSSMQHVGSALMKGPWDIPEGHYEAETMRQTVVPGRNLIMAAYLASIAESKGYETIMLGVHGGDHFIYPDCRPDFFSHLSITISMSSERKVRVSAPLLHMKKAAIVEVGIKCNVPFAITRTCYKDQQLACGKCGSCQERLEAFKLNGIEDPLPYVSRDLIPKG